MLFRSPVLIQYGADIRIEFDDGTVITEDSVLVADFFNDFAIVASRSPEHPTAPLSLDCGAVPAPGTPISALGFPFDLPEIHTQGHVAAKPVPWGDWPEIIFTDIAIAPGSSGGPAIGEDGRVVGVMVGWLPPTGISGMIPMRRICDWLQIAPQAGP